MNGPTAQGVRKSKDSGVSRLTMLYVTALSAVALLSVAGQVLIQYSLQRQLSDSTVVNIAGRQRMLSQKIAKSALTLQLANDTNSSLPPLQELQETLPLWKQSHEGLQAGDITQGLPNGNSPHMRELFAELNPAFDAIFQAATGLVNDSQNVATTRDNMRTIVSQEQKFLAGMDAIVKQYEEEARNRVTWLRRVEVGLLLVTLIVLFLEGLFIFRPAVSRIISAISALRLTSQELRIAKESAESANRAKSQFLANMSHELRTPLHAVLGMTELAQRTGLSPQQRAYLNTIDDSAQSLLGLLNDLLDMAQIEAGKLELELSPVALHELSQRAVSMMSAAAKRKRISLRCEVASDVTQFVMADALRLRQVLVNLLNNAIKFTEEGTVRLRVSRVADNTLPLFRFAVEDTGIGIPPAEQTRIFERFTQVDSSTRREFGGVGLGLSICEQLVQRMGGHIQLQSELGRGSTFSFVIPLETASEPNVNDVSTESARTRNSAAKGRSQPSLQILVAEDAEANRLVIAELLQQQGHHVTLVTDGREAVERRRTKSFDLIFMDLQMPHQDGLSAAHEIREYEQLNGLSRVPLVALSATVASHDGIHWREAGMDGFLMKPARSEELSSTIREILSLRFIDPLRACSEKKDEFAASNELASIKGRPLDSETREKPLSDHWSGVISRLGGRRELLLEIAVLFNDQAQTLMQNLKTAIDEHDAEPLILFAHRLKGQAANFDADDVRDIAAAMEEAAAIKDFVATRRHLENLNQPLKDLMQSLKSLL